MALRPGSISSQPTAGALAGGELLPCDQEIGSPVAASALVVGQGYRIVAVGSTNWQACGAGESAVIGTVFTCEAVGTGTGTAQRIDTRRVSAQTIANLAGVASAIAAHEAATDPHPAYLTPTEAAAAFQPLAANLTALAAQAGQTAFGRALLTLADQAALLAAAGAVAASDARLTEISQSDAEAGVATAPRLWSAARWREAAVAWLLTVSSALGRTLLSAQDATAARNALQLGQGDSPQFTGLTATGTATLAHIHGNLAGQLYAHVKNVSGSAIAIGTPLRIAGTVGDTTTLEVVPASATSPATMPAVFVASEALASNATGHATMAGEIQGLNTAGMTSGAPLWVPVGGGVVTPTQPGSNAQQVATVGRVHASTGSIHVLPWPVLSAGGASAPEISQAEAEAGTGTTPGIWSPLRWRQAAAAWWLTISGSTGRSVVSAADQPTALAALGAVASTDSRLSDSRTPAAGSVVDASIAAAGLSQSSINSVTITPWAANTAYLKGALVEYGGIAWRRTTVGTSGATFNTANWAQQSPSAPAYYAAGNFISPVQGVLAAGLSLAAGTIYFHPFILPRGIKVSDIGARVNTPVAGSSFVVAFYGSANGEPIGAPVGQSGTMSSGTAAAVSSAVLSQFDLLPGVLYYWAAMADAAVVFANVSNGSLTSASLIGSPTLANVTSTSAVSMVFRTITGQTFNVFPTLTAGQTTEVAGTSARGLLPFLKIASILA